MITIIKNNNKNNKEMKERKFTWLSLWKLLHHSTNENKGREKQR